jgi:alpha,alpha-trehalase
MVLRSAKQISSKLPQSLPRLNLKSKNDDLTASDVADAREYIKRYWPKLTRFHPKDDDSLYGMPNKFLVPAYEEGHDFDFNEMYYWDSYFMVQGMLDESHRELVLGVLENLLYSFERFKIIPNANRTYLTGRSQPPLLTSFIMDSYRAFGLDKIWLKKAMNIAKAEYHTVWMGTTKPNCRQAYQGLSRYYDVNYLDDLAEAESGWDYTPRFGHKALSYLPVDLNALLYKYETDFAATDELLGDADSAKKWAAAADNRRITVNKLMWSELRGMYYDYNFVKERRGRVDSLAAYYPLWAGLASQKQAAKLVSSLKKFEHKGGLAVTDGPQVSSYVPGSLPLQWAYPNGWAPLHFIVVKGLQRYGYHDDARRIALKWLKTNLDWYGKHGVFLEKYNVVQPSKPPAKGVYPSQVGFGWTNAVFERFCQDFIDTTAPR